MKKNSYSVVSWMAWMIVSIFYAYQYVLRVMPGIMVNDILEKFDITASAFGQLSGIYYIGYGLMHIPLGILMDKYGPRKIVTICFFMTAIGQLPLILSENWIYPIIGKLITGGASSGAILGVFKIIKMNFEDKKFTRMLSISVTIGLIGAIYGGGPLSYLYSYIGYEYLIQGICIVGAALSVLSYFVLPASEDEQNTSVLHSIKEVIYNKKVILGSILSGMLVGPAEGFADVWAPEFLKIVYNFSNMEAASIPSMIFVGFCFGGPLLSIIAEKTDKYLGTVICAGFIMAAAFVGLLTGFYSKQLMIVTFLMVGMCSAYQIIVIYAISKYASENVASLTIAVVNMIIMCFGYIFHSLIGKTIAFTGGIASSSAFIWGISWVPFLSFIGSIGFIILALLNKNAKPS